MAKTVNRSAYENKQIELIKDWEKQVPGVVSKSIGLLAKPAVWLVQKVVPQSAIKAALNGANSAGKLFLGMEMLALLRKCESKV